MEEILFAQRVAMASPSAKQTILNDALASERWDRVGTVLISTTPEDIEGGFRRPSDDAIRAKFHPWRDGVARIAATRAAIAEARLRVAQTQPGHNPLRDLKLAHQVEASRRAAGTNPAPTNYDPGPGLVARVKKGGV
jgi:hypothetical protein